MPPRKPDPRPREKLPDLTAHQYDMLEYLIAHRMSKGFIPSMIEIARWYGVHPSSCRQTIRHLQTKGYVGYKVPGEHRSMWFPQSFHLKGQI